MRPIRTILALVVAAGTALGLAAPAAAQAASTPCGYLVCKIAIYTGVGNNKVEIPVPASGYPATPSAAPATITTSGWGTLHFDVASQDGPGYGSCMKECSHWWVEGNPTVIEVPNFLVGSQVAHGLNDVYTTVTWGHNSAGVYWPKDLAFNVSNKEGCVHLFSNTSAHTWEKETFGSALCP